MLVNNLRALESVHTNKMVEEEEAASSKAKAGTNAPSLDVRINYSASLIVFEMLLTYV